MSSTNNTDSGASQGASHGADAGQSATIGVGNPTSGEEGATLTHETMQETGGSGGEQLTQPKNLEAAPRAPVSPEAAQRQQQGATPEPEGGGLDATAIGRGYQDTRSSQAGPGETGLGTPETGGNQDERDLAPPRKE
jgi:hypothetical protein